MMTPIEMINLKPSSTLILSSMMSFFDAIIMKPEVGLGVVGINTATSSSTIPFNSVCTDSFVKKPILQTPAR